MEILEFGNKENKSIILMHGFQCPYQIWNKYIEYYKDKYNVEIEKDVIGDTSGAYKKLLLALIAQKTS